MFFEKIDYEKNKDVEYLSTIIQEKLKKHDINSFMLGIKTLEEDSFLKKELHPALIETIKQKIKADYKTIEYDVQIIIDITRDVVSFEIMPAFVYGKYCKLSRNIAQTTHYCYECRGKGCKTCEYTGKKTKESVQEIIAKDIEPLFEAQENKFHGAGREDVDVLMLGNGREFIIELLEPKKRNISKEDLKKLEEKINKENQEKISVKDLEITTKNNIAKIKQESKQKIYGAVVVCEKDYELSLLDNYKETFVIKQKTPTRVKKRRVDKIRERKCMIKDYKKIDDKRFFVKILADAGLYIKEFISGDEERSTPNLSEIVKKPCSCESLDVLEII